MRCIQMFIFTFFISTLSFAEGEVTCGVADGFPPFQFGDNGPAGMDYEILQIVMSEIGQKMRVQVSKWDDVMGLLRLGKIDCAAGTEVNESRKKLFDFTHTIYSRRIAVFILADNKRLTSIDDLVKQRIAGDRQSFVEQYFEKKKLLHKMRVMHTPSKEESMALLHKKEVDAVIAPLEVGLYIAAKMGMKVKILGNPDPGSPVAIAVKKGDKKLLNKLNRGLENISKRDGFKKIFDKWQPGQF